ncbi:MAG TPA: hypothetical protein VLA16_06520 [Ideonella sp.]|nr:hypothetical protein [Ideonella sp.]
MGKAVKAGVLLLVVTTLVWLTTLWRWQTSPRDLSVNDVLLYLVALPLGLTLAFLLSVWAAARLRSYAGRPPGAAAAAPSAATAGSAAEASAEAERQLGFAVLAAAAHTRGGADWAALAQATSTAVPALDPELRDEHGVAVFSARTDEAAQADVRAEIDAAIAALAQQPSGVPSDIQVPAVAWRMLALLRVALARLSPALEQGLAEEAARRAASAPGAAPVASLREFQARVAVPARWPEALQAVLAQWLRERIEAAMPAGSTVAAAALPLNVHVHPVASAEEFWHLSEQQMVQWHRDEVRGLLLVLAADSLLGPAEIGELAAAGGLFSGERVNGRIPGEAAAGLLLASTAWVAEAGGEAGKVAPLARLHRASQRQRDKSADAAGRASGATAQQALEDALAASATPAAEVGALASDADHRSSRSAEVFETLQTALPHLDNSTELLRAAVACGDVGVARLLLITALAITKTQEAAAPVAVIGVDPAHARFAAIVRPPAKLPATASTSAA